jgi:hypothetical protein
VGNLEFAITVKAPREKWQPRKRGRVWGRLRFSKKFHAPNRPRRSATADNALAVLRTGAVVAVALTVEVLAAFFFTDLVVVVAAAAVPRGR